MKLLNWIKENPRALWLSYFIGYAIAFVVLERYTEPKYIIHCPLDDYIPYISAFVIPYYLWYLLIAFGLFWFLRYSTKDYLNLCYIMFGGMTICLVIYALFPNGLQLRQEIPDEGILNKMMMFMYSIDTPTNVCPSIHVSSTVSLNIVVQHSEMLKDKKWVRMGMNAAAILICLATVFVRQHSVIDVICGFLLSHILGYYAYDTQWQTSLANSKLCFLTW